MSGYPYGGNPPNYPQQQNIYPHLYNAPSAPPPPYHPTAMSYPPPIQGQNPHAYQTGHPVYPMQPPGQPTAGIGYPGTSAGPLQGNYFPNYGLQPSPIPQAPTFKTGASLEWVRTHPEDAARLADRAIVAGYEGYDGSPLWVIRAKYEGDLIPGKLAFNHNVAYIPFGGNENTVHNIEVLCMPAGHYRWVPATGGTVPEGAISGGNTASGETLYVGRSKHDGSLTPGKIHPSHRVIYISYGGKEIAHKTYEVLCHV